MLNLFYPCFTLQEKRGLNRAVEPSNLHSAFNVSTIGPWSGRTVAVLLVEVVAHCLANFFEHSDSCA